MRKVLLIWCAVLALSLTGCTWQTKQTPDPRYTSGVYELSISASLLYNDSVGNNWRKAYTCEGVAIASGKRWTVPLDTVKTVVIEVTVTESDKRPDVGFGCLSVDLVDGFKTSTFVTVTENRGRYTGNTAQWKITCRVSLVDKVG